jgi:GntR family transcriptional regulator
VLHGEREKFLTEEWPRISATIERLGLSSNELLKAARNGRSSSKLAKEGS